VKLNNMKKFLLLLTIACILQVNAQTNVYHPFPNIYSDWHLSETQYPSSGTTGSLSYSYIYYVSGDTLVNSLNYKKVNYLNQGQCYCPPTPLNQIFTGGTYNFAYRNDSANKKVYILPLNNTVEKLWYDFNLNIGDTLKNTYSTGGANPGITIIVNAIDSVLTCNNYYKRFSCSCSPTYPFGPIYLTERVGFSTHFINETVSNNCTMEPFQLYSTDAWSIDACPNGLGIKSNINANIIALYPNPAQNNFTVEVSSNEKQTLFIFDINGKQVLLQTINGTTNIDAGNLSAGVYNLSITNNQSVENKKLIIVK
ncbi:MAG: T9SS type A sorting domain-containing protein, partial [Bacteroidia bacterium]